jgi:mRNA interferase RelE/StbE
MIVYSNRARRDLDGLPAAEAKRIVDRLTAMAGGSASDVKKLRGHNEYRLRVGKYRVLFDRTGNDIIVQRVAHRKDVYRR